MCAHVYLECTIATETLPALFAFVGFFVAVHTHVYLEFVGAQKMFVADLADVNSLTRVDCAMELQVVHLEKMKSNRISNQMESMLIRALIL